MPDKTTDLIAGLVADLQPVTPLRQRRGMTVAVSYVLEDLPDAVSVPDNAVFGSAQAPLAFVAAGKGWEERAVRLGPTSGGRVVVLEGLKAGEQVSLGDPRQEPRS